METPFHFLLCHLFSIAINWAEQCEWIDEKDILQENKKKQKISIFIIFQKGYQITWCYVGVGFA